MAEGNRSSPYLTAAGLVVLIAAAAGFFAWSYTYAFANPGPQEVPVAVVGWEGTQHRAFVAGMDHALNGALVPHSFATTAWAQYAIEEQTVFAIFDLRQERRVTVEVSSASGASVAQLLEQAAPAVGRAVGVEVVVRDLNPTQQGDPRGLVIFYVTLAAVVVGFVGATQLWMHASDLGPGVRIAFTAAYSLLGAFAIVAVVDWLLGALHLPFVPVWLTLALAMYVAGALFLMFLVLIGPWAIIPTWAIIVLLGNPASGGVVSWPLLPLFLRVIGPWLPSGAAIAAIHTEVYFPGHLHVLPFLVLGGWAALSTLVFWLVRRRQGWVDRTSTADPPPRRG
ncbi:hypothetical protein SAMN05421678_103398 [Actinopolymorpha cephalotaxi]|uniref:DUF3533 domain-containing protein n=1 Tax=Actinopolymorpha cephalotaxi TaxID=504797 RepID=A0A1I2NJ43_9ACTN|nr:hypothetical protein [Actinopolymorpha cephalotaxi]NYH85494.1 hypothetical protein [Actinopolymorpha cephalotaxi]SFG03613.1 hypothetical protein SAMN05421678_103398 [Actinopolymorpha cephalotaxi]